MLIHQRERGGAIADLEPSHGCLLGMSCGHLPVACPVCRDRWARRARGRVASSNGALFGLPVVIVLVQGLRYRCVVDDGFIYLRVVRNVVEGHGPVFNLGQRVEAYTGPLWVGVLRGRRCGVTVPARVDRGGGRDRLHDRRSGARDARSRAPDA